MSTITPNYKNLTLENFIIPSSSGSVQASGYRPNNAEGGFIYGQAKLNVTATYDSDTGILTAYQTLTAYTKITTGETKSTKTLKIPLTVYLLP